MNPTVVHVRTYFLPVSETFIYRFLQHAADFTPVVVCVCRENDTLYPWDKVYAVAWPSRFAWNRVATGLLRASGIDPRANSMTGQYLPTLARIKPDIVHAHFGPEGVDVMRACQKLKIPFVVSFYGYDISQLCREARWRNAYQTLFSAAAAVIALSEDFKRRLIALGCPAEKIHVIRIGVDPQWFAFRSPPRPEGRPIRFFSVGRLVEKKGTRYTLQALARVRRKHPAIQYTHVGEGGLKTELLALAEQLEIADICDFCGAAPNAEVRRLMNEADIAVLPSVTAENGDEEGTPVFLYEAMATGLPTLSTLHSGIPEMISEGETGYLAPERDVERLAENMIRLIEHPETWQEMALRARNQLEEHFNIHTETRKLETLYSACLDQKRAASASPPLVLR